MTTYSTRTEAIQAQIIDPIEAAGSPVQDARTEYDVDAIADHLIRMVPANQDNPQLGGVLFVCTTENDPDAFWSVVTEYAR